MVVEVGHTATLPCQASGTPPPKVRWLWNSLPLDVASNPRYALLNDKMHGTLQIVKSEEEDQGKFECVAENSIGTEFSKPTSLYVKEGFYENAIKLLCKTEAKVNKRYSFCSCASTKSKVRRVAPQFSIPPPQKTEVMLGGNTTLKCVAFGSPMPTVKWRKGLSKWLTSEDNPPLGVNTLVLEDIRESANYTCEAASVLGVIEATSEVKVQSLPGAPTEVRASEVTATTVRLAWTYNGPEEPQYYVIQYKPKYANQAFSEISGVITQYYSVTNLSPYTEYEMYVIAVNNIGRGAPSEPAVITTGETGKHRDAISEKKFKDMCEVNPHWGYKIYYTTDPSQPLQSWNSQMLDSSHLTTINELTPHTVYTIRVQAFTSVGPGPVSAPVQVKTQQGVPSQPSNFVAVEAGETSVTLQWQQPAHAGDQIVSYELYWNDTYAKEHHRKRIHKMESYTLNGLYPNTLYYIWLAARSQRGEGATTPPIAVRTKQYGMLVRLGETVQYWYDSTNYFMLVGTLSVVVRARCLRWSVSVPGAPPMNVTAVAISPTAVRVSWQPPPAERANGRIAYYKLLCVEAGRGDSEATVVRLNATEFVLDELRRWTEYRVWVLAGTSVGDGPASYPVTVRTHEDVCRRAQPTSNDTTTLSQLTEDIDTGERGNTHTAATRGALTTRHTDEAHTFRSAPSR
ncbi:Tyrosine-protein phosphatase Lar [Papilio machaon]|uniref:Hemolin n=1 Tax=Papilio machaon TaxID=76193 RepID=A0A194R538_PAPMA|nr:Tyrosine-protein phosphatase Lar [Papilio machaon]